MSRLRWAPALFWMGLVFYVSSLSTVDAPEAFARSILLPLDLIGHLGEYAVLAFALLLAFLPQPFRRRVVFALPLGILYALSDELHQAFVPGRAASVGDVALDVAGVLLGVAAVAAVRWTMSCLPRKGRAIELYKDRKPGYS